MASLSFYSQIETKLMSNCNVIELLLQLKSAKAHGKTYIKVKPHLVRNLLRNRLLSRCNKTELLSRPLTVFTFPGKRDTTPGKNFTGK